MNIERDTGYKRTASALFRVDLSDQPAWITGKLGSLVGYQYVLPALPVLAPISEIRVYIGEQLNDPFVNTGHGVVTSPVPTVQDYGNMLLTLRDPTGEFICEQVPLSCFVNVQSGVQPGQPVQTRIARYFDPHTLPDPKQSYIECVLGEMPFVIAMQFVYSA